MSPNKADYTTHIDVFLGELLLMPQADLDTPAGSQLSLDDAARVHIAILEAGWGSDFKVLRKTRSVFGDAWDAMSADLLAPFLVKAFTADGDSSDVSADDVNDILALPTLSSMSAAAMKDVLAAKFCARHRAAEALVQHAALPTSQAFLEASDILATKASLPHMTQLLQVPAVAAMTTDVVGSWVDCDLDAGGACVEQLLLAPSAQDFGREFLLRQMQRAKPDHALLQKAFVLPFMQSLSTDSVEQLMEACMMTEQPSGLLHLLAELAAA